MSSESPFGKTGKSPCEQSSGKIGATRKFIMIIWERRDGERLAYLEDAQPIAAVGLVNNIEG